MFTKHELRAAGKTDVGLKRDHNEDSILVANELGVFAVADGMGGHAAGEVASEAAIKAIEYRFKQALDQKEKNGVNSLDYLELVRTAVFDANRDVCSLADRNFSYGGMGTTIAVLFLANDEAFIGHVGDSRIYRLRDGKLESLTQDHSWVNEQVQRNIISEEEARNHRWRNVITRALGNREDVEIDLKRTDLQPADTFLLCSDGLTSMIDDKTIVDCLNRHRGDIEQICNELIRISNESGGTDNISVVLVRVES